MEATEESAVKRKSIGRLLKRIPQNIATTVEHFFYR